ncbi:MAG: ABC transporter permease [Bacteroidota bacterium]|nr:ABC transporter permease [Bacteroidota bacterium]
MLHFILRRIFQGVVSLAFIALIGLWMIDQIPGSYADLSKQEQQEMISDVNGFTKSEISTIPIFYVGFIPEIKQGQNFSLASLLPDFKWHGTLNQYHIWLKGLLRGNLGKSIKDGTPVSTKISTAVSWSVSFQLPAILLIFFVSLKFSFWSITKKNSFYNKIIPPTLLGFHSIPVFWFCGLLLVFFSNPVFLNWFPGNVTAISEKGAFKIWFTDPQYLVLPLIALIVPSLAYLYRLIYHSMLSETTQLYFKRARSVGLSQKTILRNEVLPIAMVPVTAWVASAFRTMISGSLIIENIFGIPGTGRLLFQSIYYRDWPVVYHIFLLGALMTIIGLLIADILLRYLDPRTQFIHK